MATSVTLKPNAIDISGSTSGTTTLQASAVAGTTTLTLPAATDTLVGKATTDTLTNKTLTGAAMNGTLGATTPSTASVTTLTTSSTVTHSGGTANGVAYLDGSKVLTTGSALVFDGTNFGVGVTPSAWGTFKAVEFNGGSLASYTGNNLQITLTQNAYFNGTNYIYKNTQVASRYSQDTGSHIWYNAASGTAGNTISFTQAMTLDASGNLALGTTSSLSPSSGRIDLTINGTSSAMTSFGTGNTRRGYFLHDATDLTIASETAGSLRFLNNGSERARIDSSGNLLVGTTNTTFSSGGIRAYANNSFEVVRDGSAGSTTANVYLNKTGSTDGSIISFNRSGTQVGTISVTGSATAYNTSSDYRLKDITGSLTGYKERLSALQPKQGSWKADGSYFRGFLAHEFAVAYPASVAGEKDAVDADGKPQYQGMQAGSSEVIADLVAYIKELETRLTALEQA